MYKYSKLIVIYIWLHFYMYLNQRNNLMKKASSKLIYNTMCDCLMIILSRSTYYEIIHAYCNNSTCTFKQVFLNYEYNHDFVLISWF